MVEHDSHTLDTIFHALGDTTRRAMLGELAAGERTVGELAEPFAMSLAAASKHIKVLEAAGLVRRDIRGRTHMCSLDPVPLMRADRWIGIYRRFWTDRLDVLEKILRAKDATPPPPPKEAPPGKEGE
ncbi:DNA-binding transcriptional ArsR family regulator [Sphingopyxis italica]|uniref:DNA-binding transcriptional ArsR family regulator n=1 Tax=Sphingopyxis italica TaxID=1129133 RepID=A0A7X5XUC7_9SPHN|nr:metalloregulator ArsR/SmtB family transcription factor [Sphingopyxis italica]NJB91124.1 DNA-binding transcriptional ArsR family regulator [Sphingopyxis italica]